MLPRRRASWDAAIKRRQEELAHEVEFVPFTLCDNLCTYKLSQSVGFVGIVLPRTTRGDRQVAIILAGAALHNLCVDAAVSARAAAPTPRLRRRPWRPRDRTAAGKRNELARRLQLAGLRRPPLPY